MISRNSSVFKLSVSMVIFGTIGLFVRYIPLSSALIALVRGVIGSIFLIGVMMVTRRKISLEAVKKNFIYLLLSGFAIGFNWILLFESYRYTSVAVSTLCYYTAPIIVIMASPVFFKEKLTVKSVLCVVSALVGMVFISGILQSGISNFNEMKGILCGLGAAVLYASVMLLNNPMKDIDAYDKTILQLSISALTLVPYCLLSVDFKQIQLQTTGLIMLIIVGVIHTGFSYYLYFGAMGKLKPQTVAVLSYVDPLVAVVISALILKEYIGPETLVGAVLILGASVISELPSRGNKA